MKQKVQHRHEALQSNDNNVLLRAHLQVCNEKHVEVVDHERLVALTNGVQIQSRVNEAQRQQAAERSDWLLMPA